MDYEKVYDHLYTHGYQKGINIGKSLVEDIVTRYDFTSILDVGCSQGIAVKEYQQHGKIAYGIDVSPVAIDQAKESGLTTCTVGSIINIPFEDKEFDAVVTSDVLEHLVESDIQKAIDELYRVTANYLFVRVSQALENDTKWACILSDTSVKNLHQSIHSYMFWKSQIAKRGMLFIGRFGRRIFAFQRIDMYTKERGQ